MKIFGTSVERFVQVSAQVDYFVIIFICTGNLVINSLKQHATKINWTKCTANNTSTVQVQNALFRHAGHIFWFALVKL